MLHYMRKNFCDSEISLANKSHRIISRFSMAEHVTKLITILFLVDWQFKENHSKIKRVNLPELELRQQCGHLPQEALLLTVSDPQQRLGSGGATLNALLVATEHLSSRAGHTVSDSAIVLKGMCMTLTDCYIVELLILGGCGLNWEMLSQVVTADVLDDAHILILHTVRN